MPSSFDRRPMRLLLCLSALIPATATAQDAPVILDTIHIFADRDEGIGLNDAATSSSRLGVAVRDVPATVSTVSGASMAARGQHTVAQAVTQGATGATSVGPGVLGSAFALRGFQGNNSVMQVYDGTRLFPGRGNITFPHDSWLVERIEVLNGAGSVVHGTGAIGGTVDVQRKLPFAGTPTHVISGLAGSDRRLRAAVDSGGSLSERLSYRLAIAAEDGDGWIDGTGRKLAAGTASLAWQARDDLKITLSADYARQEPMAYFGTPLRDGRIVPGTEHLNYNVDDARNRFTDRWLQLRGEWTPAENVAVTATLYGIGSRRDFRNAETYLWNPATDIVTVDEFRTIRQDQDQHGLRTEVRLDQPLWGRDSRTVIGFDVNRAESEFANAAAFGARAVDPFAPDAGLFPTGLAPVPQYRSTLDQQSLFVENRTELTPALALNIGLRHDWLKVERDDRVNAAGDFSSRFKAPSARVGLVWTPDAQTSVFGQLAWATDPVNMPLLDYMASMQDFDLTTGRQIEFGIRQSTPDDWAQWSISVFDIIRRNVLVVDPATWTTAQAGRQSSRGLEVAASLQVTDTFRIQGNAAWTRARYDEFSTIDWLTFDVVDYSGKVPMLVPEVSANLWASWDFAPDWTAHAGVQFVGKSFYDHANTATRDAFTLVNAGLDWTPAPDTVVALRVTNLFDETYAAYLRTDPSTERAQAILGEPRRFELQLTKKF